MPAVKVTVLVEVDGVPVDGFPMVRRAVVDQVASFNPYLKPTGTYSAIPAPSIGVLQALVLRPDAPIVVRMAAQSDAGVDIGADGLLILLGADVDNGAGTNATVSAAADTLIRGLAAGAAS